MQEREALLVDDEKDASADELQLVTNVEPSNVEPEDDDDASSEFDMKEEEVSADNALFDAIVAWLTGVPVSVNLMQAWTSCIQHCIGAAFHDKRPICNALCT